MTWLSSPAIGSARDTAGRTNAASVPVAGDREQPELEGEDAEQQDADEEPGRGHDGQSMPGTGRAATVAGPAVAIARPTAMTHAEQAAAPGG